MLTPNVAFQARPVRRPRTIELILSVMERKVWPVGAYFSSALGGPASGRDVSVAMSLRLQHGVRVAQRRQVRRPRVRVQVGQQAVVQRRLLPALHRTLAVVHVAE